MKKTKDKKAHVIKFAGVSETNGVFKLNVSGRANELQLFQVAVPGVTTYNFFTLPNVMTKPEVVTYLITTHMAKGLGLSENALVFLRALENKFFALANKVPGKRGRPKKVVTTTEKPVKAQTVKTAKAETKTVKVVVAQSEKPAKVSPLVKGDADKAAVKAANMEKLRALAGKYRHAKKA